MKQTSHSHAPATVDVSHETMTHEDYGQDAFMAEFLSAHPDARASAHAALRTYAEMLLHWQRRMNLIGRSTIPQLWWRHFRDCARLLPLLQGKTGPVIDMGSGAGFPGLVIAMLAPHLSPGIDSVTLVESDTAKATFLQAVIDKTGVKAHVCPNRIESASALLPKAGVITARALAPLGKLLAYAAPLARENADLYFFKGIKWQDELTDACHLWHIESYAEVHPSAPEHVILHIKRFHRRRNPSL